MVLKLGYSLEVSSLTKGEQLKVVKVRLRNHYVVFGKAGSFFFRGIKEKCEEFCLMFLNYSRKRL